LTSRKKLQKEFNGKKGGKRYGLGLPEGEEVEKETGGSLSVQDFHLGAASGQPAKVRI